MQLLCVSSSSSVTSSSISFSLSWSVVSLVLLLLLSPQDDFVSRIIQTTKTTIYPFYARTTTRTTITITGTADTTDTITTTTGTTTTTNKPTILLATAYSVKGDPYIYPTPYEPVNSSFPVQDYRSPYSNDPIQLQNDRPNFIYNPDPNIYRIVEFYVHWCGRCRAFKSHYIAITRRVIELALQQNKVVEVYAVSCTPNKPLCIAQGIRGYPRVKVFRNGGDTSGILIPFESFAPYTILEKLGIPTPPENEIEDWDVNGAIVEAEIDMIGIPDTVHHHYHDHNPNSIDDSNNNQGFLSYFINQFLNWLVPIDIDTPDGLAVGHTYSNLPPEERRKLEFIYNHKRTRIELKDDIHLSFDFVLRNGIYLEDGALSDERRQALHSFLMLLAHTIPPTWSSFHKLISELTTDFHYVVRTEEYLHGVLNDHPVIDNTTEWTPACTHGGDPSLGFTCGMWELLHTATVGTMHYNMISEKPLGTEMVGRVIKDFIVNFFPCDVCRENFLKQYNNCEYNRCNRLSHEHSHVIPKKLERHKSDIEQDREIALRNAYNTSEGMELPLWLFEVHNGVNIRLLHERIEQENEKRAYLLSKIPLNQVSKRASLAPIVVTPENEMDVVWPSRIDCPTCWVINSTTSSTIVGGDTSTTGSSSSSNDPTALQQKPTLTTESILQYNREPMIKYIMSEYGAEMDDNLISFHKSIVEQSKKAQYIQEEQIHMRHLQYRHEQRQKQYKIAFQYILFGTLVMVGMFGLVRYYSSKHRKTSMKREIKKDK